VRRLSHRLCLVLVALLLVIAGCGDDDDANGNGPNGGNGEFPPAPTADEGCEDVTDHPNRATAEARGFVVACLSNDETSVHVRNVSSHVLMVFATPSVSRIEPAGVAQEPGVQAALSITGIGWTQSRSHFVLPLGGALVGSGAGPAVVRVEPDLILTAEANAARYVAEWMASRIQARGQALARRVESCATTAAEFAQTNAYVEDVLRGALGTANCATALSDAIREQGQDPSFELPRARTAVLKIAQPVAEDRLISFAARILAR
jgi:hypothetical protein